MTHSPLWRLVARANVRSDRASITVTPSIGRASSHSADDELSLAAAAGLCLASCPLSLRGRAVLRALLIFLVVGQEEKGGSICRCDQKVAKPERLLRAEREQHRLLDPV